MDDPKPRRPLAPRVVAAAAAVLVIALTYEVCAPHAVEFRVSGEGKACDMDVTYRDGAGGTKEVHHAGSTWQGGAATARYGADLYLLATGQCDVLECVIVVDGKEWRKKSARLAVDCGGMLGEK
jgi:hypothetical protein